MKRRIVLSGNLALLTLGRNAEHIGDLVGTTENQARLLEAEVVSNGDTASPMVSRLQLDDGLEIGGNSNVRDYYRRGAVRTVRPSSPRLRRICRSGARYIEAGEYETAHRVGRKVRDSLALLVDGELEEARREESEVTSAGCMRIRPRQDPMLALRCCIRSAVRRRTNIVR